MSRFPDGFPTAYKKLVMLSVNASIATDSHLSCSLNSDEVRLLVGVASISSLSDQADMQSLAYEICSRLIECYVDVDDLISSADMILSRVGNFPGRSLLRRRFRQDSEPDIPFSLSLERIARQAENSLENGICLTNFQYRLYHSLSGERALSVSAPTSAGKSYVLNLELIRRLGEASGKCIVYVVPTRALVTEVVGRIRTTVREENMSGIVIRTAPFPVKLSCAVSGVVFVLTQERLLSLLAISKDKTAISLLIVDEAHELKKGNRGILLQNAVDLALKQSPMADVFFASPLIQNPGYLLNLFQREKDGHFFTEEVSPVSQNLLLVAPVSGKPNIVEISSLINGSLIRVGRSTLDFSFRDSVAVQKARFALKVCKPGESVIVFASSAAEAEKTAMCAASYVHDFEAPAELLDFINFIRAEIHEEYPLIMSLTMGVGFHYGNMPSIVRAGVERFFKDGTIRFLASTSTLLQGVNLPAKHIVIHNPHLGPAPMERADFRNLAGRAGRLLNEFHGNVWCIRPMEWEVASFQGAELQEISSAMSNVMQDGGSLIQGVLGNDVLAEDKDLGDAAFSRLFHELRGDGDGEQLVRINYATEANNQILSANIDSLKSLIISLPVSFLDSHRSLRPDMLQRLYEQIAGLEFLDLILLIKPHETGGKQRMSSAVALIYNAFDIQTTEKQQRWICGVAHEWVWGKPIGEMLVKRVDLLRARGVKDSASKIIRDLLKLIETEIRFNLVRYFAAFEDLLRIVLKERGREVDECIVAPYHVYLEFGSSDQISLGLMAVGLSRFTAIRLSTAVFWGDTREPEDLLKKLASIRLATLSLPKVCQAEIRELLGYQ
ncbi:ATP-dependent DNA helicase [Massilia eurypsychrophila]|uniref:ATP-dependent DNA helicase n=1 Tax=Massilia eurypsychrophila TaxID=1485217 RepID=A0A2G8T7Z6_9BURK|nr:DEAD/DEAH box helicase [Massilia eurypsychrophila]PIL42180.1 ATP-dependent DNA helicase [Massilia eurypsychrophila]